MDLVEESAGAGPAGCVVDQQRGRCGVGLPGRGVPVGSGSDAEPEVSALFCRILGPIEIEIDGVAADLGGPRTRKVLAALSTGVGAPIPDDELIEQVWGDRRPGNITQALRTIISRLRVGLGPYGHRYLHRHHHGYALVIPVSLTDHGLLSALVVRAQQHLAGNDPAAAVADLESAVALWRGDPWQDLAEQPELTGARARLAELRDSAVEELQAARLALGDTASAVAALTHAVNAAPYRERRWELLALGLYRGGRQTEALNALRHARRHLSADTGTDPGPALQTLEQRILHHDPTLLASQSTADSSRLVPTASPTPDEHHERSTSTPATAIQIVLHPDTLNPGWAGFARLPALTAADLRKANADNAARLRATGYRVDNCLIETGASGIDAVRRALAAKRYDTVFIGAEICLTATDTPLLEAIINTVHTMGPHSRFMIGRLAITSEGTNNAA